MGPAVLAAVLFEDDMKVGPPEAEGAGTGPARDAVGPIDPGAGFRVDVEGAFLEIDLMVRLLDSQGGGEHLVVEGHGHFGYAGRPGRSFQVPDHRFHRSDGTALELGFRLLEDMGEGHQLGLVAHDRARSVGLHQGDRGGREASSLVSAVEGKDLSLQPGCGKALGPPVTRTSHALDHGIDTVLVALGVDQTLQDEHGLTFTQDHSVRAVVKSIDPAPWRDGHGF